MIIAQQGGPRSYHDILRGHRHPESEPLAMPTFHEVAEAVKLGEADMGIIAVENGIYGDTPGQLELRNNFEELVVVAEDYLDITHYLAGSSSAQVAEIHGHPVALGQCRKNTQEKYASAKVVQSDTDIAAEYVAELIRNSGTSSVAAITSRAALEANPELEIIESDFNDQRPNLTRFLTIRRACDRHNGQISGANKTSTILEIPDVDGSLAKVLTIFADHKMGFSYIAASELRADSMDGSIIVTLDINHGWDSDEYRSAERELDDLMVAVRNLGSYVAGEVIKV